MDGLDCLSFSSHPSDPLIARTGGYMCKGPNIGPYISSRSTRRCRPAFLYKDANTAANRSSMLLGASERMSQHGVYAVCSMRLYKYCSENSTSLLSFGRWSRVSNDAY